MIERNLNVDNMPLPSFYWPSKKLGAWEFQGEVRCCLHHVVSSRHGSEGRNHNFLLTAEKWRSEKYFHWGRFEAWSWIQLSESVFTATYPATDIEFQCSVIIWSGLIQMDEEEKVSPLVVFKFHVMLKTLAVGENSGITWNLRVMRQQRVWKPHPSLMLKVVAIATADETGWMHVTVHLPLWDWQRKRSEL